MDDSDILPPAPDKKIMLVKVGTYKTMRELILAEKLVLDPDQFNVVERDKKMIYTLKPHLKKELGYER